MRPNQRFLRKPKSFWACVRTISQEVGYTVRAAGRGNGPIRVPSAREMAQAFADLNLDPKLLRNDAGGPTELGAELHSYFEYRAEVLNNHVRSQLMDMKAAKAEFERLRKELCPKCPLPMNKQKGVMKAPAFLTGMVNMLIEAHSQGLPCDFDPRELTTITKGGVPVRTLARRVDGAFPSAVNPVAVWEIKEYYYTTTFGSRVADGIYESLLDGMELEELREHEKVDIRHYLMADAFKTWWEDGRSYLCRMVDMVHMGYVDEVLFGREVISEMPRIVSEWVRLEKTRADAEPH